jgi:hypothetical protein
MNERIKKLLFEAGGQYDGENHLTGKTRIYTDDVDYEKFAELIVKECADIAADELRRLHEEATEQARLLGISAERELALLAKIDRMERQLGEAVWNYGEKVRANQELLEALAWIANRCPVHLMDHPLHNIHKEMAHDAGARARAAIAKAGETK